MEYSTASLSSIKLPGQQHDFKKCFTSSNAHFTCLDQVNDRFDNHNKCPTTYSVWTTNCDVGIRRYQMDTREQQKKDQLLYTKESLQSYNKAKNLEGKGILPPKNLNFAF